MLPADAYFQRSSCAPRSPALCSLLPPGLQASGITGFVTHIALIGRPFSLTIWNCESQAENTSQTWYGLPVRWFFLLPLLRSEPLAIQKSIFLVRRNPKEGLWRMHDHTLAINLSQQMWSKGGNEKKELRQVW
jgi:hypothetical protein